MRIGKFSAIIASTALLLGTTCPASARGYGHWHRDRGIDAGDVIAGILVLGGIAAIASAASRNKSDRDQYEPRAQDYRDDDVTLAANRCGDAAERQFDGQLEQITSVSRDGRRWQVAGDVAHRDGPIGFLCGVTGGRIDYLQRDDRYQIAGPEAEGEQSEEVEEEGLNGYPDPYRR